MKRLFIVLFLLNALFIFSQEIEFIEKLNEQKTATYYDLVKSFCYLDKIDVTDNFENDVAALNQNIKRLPKNYAPDKKLTVGTFSLLTLQYLKIESGLFYLASHSGRYAARELVNRGFFPNNTSEWEILSGSDLIRNIQKVVEYAEEK